MGRDELLKIPIASIDVGTNVRVNVAELDELAASIQEHGVLQPIKVRRRRSLHDRLGPAPVPGVPQAGLETIPAIVDVDEQAAGDLAIEQLVENLHRADLPPLDRARAMRAGRRRRHEPGGPRPRARDRAVDDLERPRPARGAAAIQKAIEAGELTPSHAKALKGLAPKTQQELARDAIANGWSRPPARGAGPAPEAIAEREAQQQRANEEQSKKNLERLQASIEELAAKKKPGLDTEIVVFQDYDRDPAKSKSLAARSRRPASRRSASPRATATSPRARRAATARRGRRRSLELLVLSGGYTTKLQVTPACVVPKHRQDKAAADRKAEQASTPCRARPGPREADGWRVGRARGARAIAVDRILAEAILWDVSATSCPSGRSRAAASGTSPGPCSTR
jgi:ParB-like chromosome segregation protein Spo0J